VRLVDCADRLVSTNSHGEIVDSTPQI